MAGRYFGGQYDSVKQAAYLDNILKSEKYVGKLPYQVILDEYTARIRLDILLGGHVIITDAMFYDGIYFQTLFLHKEKREDFINFLKLLMIGGMPPLIEVRQRGDTSKNTLLKMMFKKGAKSGFIFSSLAQNYVKEAVATTIAKIQQTDELEFHDWTSFLTSAVDYAESEVVKDEIKQKIEILKYMEEVPSNILKPWDREYNFGKVLDDAIKQDRFRMQRTGDALIDDVIASMEKELLKPFPDRSKLQNEVAAKTEILVRPPKTLPEKVLERLWGQFLQVYNRTIGIQHHCDTFDIGEIQIRDEKVDLVMSDSLSQATLQALARESWTDFGKRFNNISTFRNKWLYEVWELEEKRKHSFKDAQVSLDDLVKQILQEYKIKPSFQDVVELVGGGASLDVDLMNPNGISLGVSTKLLKIPVQTIDLIKKQWTYKKDNLNITEYGQKFMKGL